MIAGIRTSGCEKRVWRHNDLEHLEQLLAETDPSLPKLIAFESVYSMDGDIAPIHAICDLAENFGPLTIPDKILPVASTVPAGEGFWNGIAPRKASRLIRASPAK